MKCKTSNIEIDWSLQLSDCVKEAQKMYPLAKNASEASACFFNYCVALMATPQEDVFYRARLRVQLLGLILLTKPQFN